MIKKIKNNVWQLHFHQFGSCVYLIKLNNKNILIDTSTSLNKQELIQNLQELNTHPRKINTLILTHNHFDHVENIELFENAEIYASKIEFPKDKIQDINNLDIDEFKIIQTPGHSKAGICILYNNILFSGDTIFHNGRVGRTDLEGGSYKELLESIKKLSKIPYEILCPGHI